MASYSIWLMEYAHIPTQAVSVVLAGQQIEIVGGKLDDVIIEHETDSWEIYRSWQTEDKLNIPELNLAPGGITWMP